MPDHTPICTACLENADAWAARQIVTIPPIVRDFAKTGAKCECGSGDNPAYVTANWAAVAGWRSAGSPYG